MKRISYAACSVIAWSGLAGPAWCQDTSQPEAKIRVDTTLVLIPVTVTDPLNRFVLGLRKQDFHLGR